jgi:hypothetical protein
VPDKPLRSLADILGVPDPARPDEDTSVYDEPKTAREFALKVLNSPEYRFSVYRRLMLHEFPPALEVLLHHYAYGKPVEKVEVKDTSNPLEATSLTNLKERVITLQRIISQLESDDAPDTSSSDDSKTIH